MKIDLAWFAGKKVEDAVFFNTLLEIHREHGLMMKKILAHKGISSATKKEILGHAWYIRKIIEAEASRVSGKKWEKLP